MARSKKASRKVKSKDTGGRKKDTSGGKDQPLDLNTILSQADVAMETSNIETALQLYQHVSSNLHSQLASDLSIDMSEKDDASEHVTLKSASTDNIQKILLLSKVLSKLGEAKVSFGDPEGGKEDFLASMQVLNSLSDIMKNNGLNCNTNDDDINMDTSNQLSSENQQTLRAEWLESTACIRMFIGQLSCAEEALECIQGAIQDLKECVKILEVDVHQQETSMMSDVTENCQNALSDITRQLCGAYCSAAELYLTDLCYEPNAENECESFLQTALKVKVKINRNGDSSQQVASIDALQGMANLRLSQNRGSDAIEYIISTYDQMREGCEAMAELVGLGNKDKKATTNASRDSESNDEPKEIQEKAHAAIESLPGYEFRCQTAKLLLECSSLGNDNQLEFNKKAVGLVEASIQVLGSLLAENDEVIEIWYLLGCAFSSLTPPNKDVSRYYWNEALEMLGKVKKGMIDEGNASNDEVEDIDGKIHEIQQRLTKLYGSDAPMDLEG